MPDQTQPYAGALAAFRLMSMLADEHHADLDAPARLMSAHAWVGGGAPAFAADLAGRRAEIQAALASALRAMADLVIRQGGPALAPPGLFTCVSMANAAPSRFRGVEPAAMTALISRLRQAGERLPEAGSRLAALLGAHGLPSGAGAGVGRIGEWAEIQSVGLTRRLAVIRRTVPGTLSAATVGYGLFGAHAASSVETLLAKLSAQDTCVLAHLLVLQESGADAGLAARVNAWWQTLGPDLQERLTTLPGFGLLNGLPALVRDRANRHWLLAEKNRLNGLAPIEEITDQLKRIDLIERQLRPHPGYPPPLLLGFDLRGQGRLIVSWGDPDTADIVVTSVSGFTSGLDAAHADLERSRALWQQATATSGGRSVASITWLGYDAPQLDPGLFDPDRSVAFSGAAVKGGKALAAFADGLRASHEPSGTARSIIVGHSYGSLTTGRAAVLRPGQLADDIILIGSPGVGVSHASGLGIDPQHVWVGEAGGDPVATLGRFGADPGDASFGARHIPAGRDLWTSAHSSYWNQDSPSLRNLGSIINGQYDQLVHPEPRDNRPQLLMPEFAREPTLRPDPKDDPA
ncbi:alpha/beta hydrolase [Nonomuraea longicatena]|uniref:DUF1023 domain-containing protein n=1 Tax=Nonomuraea longicatena TaxID=83682 RepID=A0ABP3ZLJ5_9ACTN